MHFRFTTLLSLTSSLLLPSAVNAKDVFAHYMLGGNSDAHCRQDVELAVAMNFTGFALNIGEWQDDWATRALASLFDAASESEFKLFFSLDTFARADITRFNGLLGDYTSHKSYYRAGPDSLPFVSTFGAAKTSPSDWSSFLSREVPGGAFFVPNFDNAPGYAADVSGWLSNGWKDVVDGLFGWESNWPGPSNKPSNVSTEADERTMAALGSGKTYMMGMSPVSYKHLRDAPGRAHWYRPGETNLPERMTQILALNGGGGGSSSSADSASMGFVEILTWNDAGESHYVTDNVWSEGIVSDEIRDYANVEKWSHAGWQGLVASFNIAWHDDKTSAADMLPPPSVSTGGDGDPKMVEGAMWYRALLKDAACGNDPLGKPDGWQAAQDAVNWAVVAGEEAGQGGWSVKISSDGQELQTLPLGRGLNYGSVPGMKVGAQKVEVLNGDGTVVFRADSKMDVAADMDGYCNFNYQVAGLEQLEGVDVGGSGSGSASGEENAEDGNSTEAAASATRSSTTSSVSQTTTQASQTTDEIPEDNNVPAVSDDISTTPEATATTAGTVQTTAAASITTGVTRPTQPAEPLGQEGNGQSQESDNADDSEDSGNDEESDEQDSDTPKLPQESTTTTTSSKAEGTGSAAPVEQSEPGNADNNNNSNNNHHGYPMRHRPGNKNHGYPRKHMPKHQEQQQQQQQTEEEEEYDDCI